MARTPRNPDEAPRGKAWAVIRMSHVAGGMPAPHMVIQRQKFALRSDAERAASHVDRRLQPTLLLVDLATEENP